MVPDSARVFDVDGAIAKKRLSLDDSTLSRLTAAGLACRRDRYGSPLFDFGDLHYVALRLRLRNAYWAAMSLWKRTLDGVATREATCFEISYLLRDLNRPFSDAVTVLLPRERRVSVRTWKQPIASFIVSVAGKATRLPKVIEDAVVSGPALDFRLFPPGTPREVAVQSAMADCSLGATLLVDHLREVGLSARLIHGLLISVPYSVPHTWAEVRSDEGWLPVDPLLMSTIRWLAGDQASRQVPIKLLTGLALSRRIEPIVQSESVGLQTTFATRVRAS